MSGRFREGAADRLYDEWVTPTRMHGWVRDGRERLRDAKDRVRHVLRAERFTLKWWERALAYSINLGRFGLRRLQDDQAGTMAAALTYRTLFSLIPVTVLGLLVFRAFGGFDSVGRDFQQQVYSWLNLSMTLAGPEAGEPKPEGSDLLNALGGGGPDAVAGTQPADPATGPGVAGEPDEPVARRVNDLMDLVNTRVGSVSFTSIGVAGATLLIWAALALVVTVERCFNRIWRIGAGRKWHLRVPVYWSVLTLGSVLLWASFTLTASVVDWARGVPFLGPVVAAASGLGGLVASFLLLLLMYRLMPNTKVQMRPAIVGALVAAVLLEAAKWGFGLYVNNAIGLKNVYGSLAAIPLFLFWVYIIWLIVLFGMELTATLQLLPDQPARNPKRRSADDDELHPDPRLMVPLMTAIGLAFERGEAVDDSVLANRLNIAPRVVLALGQCLVGAGLLHRVEGDSPGYALARPPQRIGLGQVLDAGDCLRDRGEEQDLPGGGALRRLRDAQRGALDQVALSDVLDEEHAADLPDTAGGR